MAFYKEAGARGEQMRCRRCAAPFASVAMVRDLMRVEHELGFAYDMDSAGGATHYQEICPRCRRAMLGLAQGALWGGRPEARASSTEG